MTRLVLVVLLLLLVAGTAPHGQQPDPAALTREGYALIERSQLAEARKRFEAALAAQPPRAVEADANRGLGIVLYQLGRWNDAPAPLEKAIAAYRELGDRLGEARALDQLGSAGAMTRRPDADASYRRAIEIFAAAGERVEQARSIRNRSHLQDVPLSEKIPMLERAFDLAEGTRSAVSIRRAATIRSRSAISSAPSRCCGRPAHPASARGCCRRWPRRITCMASHRAPSSSTSRRWRCSNRSAMWPASRRASACLPMPT
jgi:tetratricopeptide (TPR) repeat protein